MNNMTQVNSITKVFLFVSPFIFIVKFFSFPDHHPPPVSLYFECVKSIDAWLSADPNRVVVVHCKAGR